MLTWEAKTKGCEKDFFYWGKGMEEKFLTMSAHLEDYVGEKYGPSALAYMTKKKKFVREKPKEINKRRENQTDGRRKSTTQHNDERIRKEGDDATRNHR